MGKDAIDTVCRMFAGVRLVVVDETYIDYCDRPTMAAALETHAIWWFRVRFQSPMLQLV